MTILNLEERKTGLIMIAEMRNLGIIKKDMKWSMLPTLVTAKIEEGIIEELIGKTMVKSFFVPVKVRLLHPFEEVCE